MSILQPSNMMLAGRRTNRNQTWTWNPSDKSSSGLTLSNGNRTALSTAGSTGARAAALSMLKKNYFEVHIDVAAFSTAFGVSFVGSSFLSPPGSGASGAGYGQGGALWLNNVTSTPYATYASGDAIGVAVDGPKSLVWFSKNGVWQAGDPVDGVGGLTPGAVPFALECWHQQAGGQLTIPLKTTYYPPLGFDCL